jgi:hypothetical protein
MGDSRANAFQAATNTDVLFDSAVDVHDHVLSSGELEVGVEWCQNCGNANVFVQPAFVGMLYHNAGAAGVTTAIGDVSFLGFSFVAGIRY